MFVSSHVTINVNGQPFFFVSILFLDFRALYKLSSDGWNAFFTLLDLILSF